ncbi:hypothetical protein LCI18_002516 [Fusarium solani-melongenae]|uniref:Uncharacterized protein n=1 Tax=Fusarium solani subsp. cucurbitae TaxID=2747967 RepID=A0ACD3YSJ8_FUSSC|nr:hypothetical protein LCI18_002516 [Fusarium solani-melongenae]
MERSPCIKRQGKPTESFARRGLRMNAAEADPSNVPAPCPVQGFSMMDPTPSRSIHPFTVYQMSPSHTIRKVLPSLMCMRELQPFIRNSWTEIRTGQPADELRPWSQTDRQGGTSVMTDGPVNDMHLRLLVPRFHHQPLPGVSSPGPHPE